jgi:glyoxylase I family protein
MEPPFRVVELDHVVIRCRDQSSMLAFYTQVLGLHEERRIEALGLVQLRAETALIDLVPTIAPPSAEGANVDHFCLGLETASFDATISFLREKGVTVADAPAIRYGARGFGLSIYIRDPEGNLIELKQITSESFAG